MGVVANDDMQGDADTGGTKFTIGWLGGVGISRPPVTGVHCWGGNSRLGWVTTGTICPLGRISAEGCWFGCDGTVFNAIGPDGVLTITVWFGPSGGIGGAIGGCCGGGCCGGNWLTKTVPELDTATFCGIDGPRVLMPPGPGNI